ncbi:molybdenum cofactor guanylyltransferase [Desulfovibrio subterraneus]|uniref:Probable molybdenum cofactor guanylyltransferase n=1 Tax=Desulfovibrio subterraneus TaxID=2718620 RepID=A0A7J0BGQ8_9BACT|nr:molybdenum cofactor guanylyltransferase [Desulfovibrio subterraneus]GFM32856.1 molybdenum cofactor guanylyltransferase [Desulfovibrio subterraneus]
MSEGATEPLTGIVLAGGLSTRLGNDKTVLRLHGESGPDMLTRACGLLAQVTDEVWISGRTTKPRANGYFWICDEQAGLGPIGGVVTALRAAQGPVMVLSCDLPFMDEQTLAMLIEKRRERTENTLMTTFLQVETGFIESLVAIYEFAALPHFEAAIERGLFKLSRVIDKSAQLHIPYTSKDSLPFFNINYPADLEMARRIIAAL